jgi:hypothetical protein
MFHNVQVLVLRYCFYQARCNLISFQIYVLCRFLHFKALERAESGTYCSVSCSLHHLLLAKDIHLVTL